MKECFFLTNHKEPFILGERKLESNEFYYILEAFNNITILAKKNYCNWQMKPRHRLASQRADSAVHQC